MIERPISEYTDDEIEQIAEAEGDFMAQFEAAGIEADENREVSIEIRNSLAESKKEFIISRYHHERARKELSEYGASWDNITSSHVVSLTESLNRAKREEDLQIFLSTNPIFLIQHLGGGHGRYVIPKAKLGSEFATDFLIAEMSSIGLEWHAIELESPLLHLSTKNGTPTSKLTHAVQQILDWRSWLTENLDYARKSKPYGLGLVGIYPPLPATIIAGRREDFNERFNNYRRTMELNQHILIHSYDWLIDMSQDRIKALRR